ncbi:hypothetical protein CBL_13581 [Carabus blaptoides fortunei]
MVHRNPIPLKARVSWGSSESCIWVNSKVDRQQPFLLTVIGHHASEPADKRAPCHHFRAECPPRSNDGFASSNLATITQQRARRETVYRSSNQPNTMIMRNNPHLFNSIRLRADPVNDTTKQNNRMCTRDEWFYKFEVGTPPTVNSGTPAMPTPTQAQQGGAGWYSTIAETAH